RWEGGTGLFSLEGREFSRLDGPVLLTETRWESEREMATATKERKKSKRETFQASTPDLERDYAELLWGQLAEGLESADQAVRLIVRNRAWEPLGYGTFTEVWNDRLEHITLATD